MVERRLRCRTIELGRSVEPADLDEYRPGLLGAAPPHRRECSLGMAAPNIGRHPDRRLETHWPNISEAHASGNLCSPSTRPYVMVPASAFAGACFAGTTGRYQSRGRPVTAASSRVRRSEIWPVTGSLR